MSDCQYITLKDVMQQLSISRNTVYRLIHQRGLRYTRIGRIIKINKADFDKWIQDNTSGGDCCE